MYTEEVVGTGVVVDDGSVTRMSSKRRRPGILNYGTEANRFNKSLVLKNFSVKFQFPLSSCTLFSFEDC